ncbi:hypothetical protein AcW1_002174 [Taiwanofungus camphoratus]|nr:hypothetical protein AcV5_010165 [Antrodia cinnamomea]KAI0944479.1 hypothetical protein AcW1_002174 [Antrodia cinnamomea]KAI0946133.1 hypothetical protein AcV7_010184 [Antrodia cinnamomea]
MIESLYIATGLALNFEMKRLFGRDKVKVRGASDSKDGFTDVASGAPTENYTHSQHLSQRYDRSQAGTPHSSDEHWNMIDNDSQSYTVRSTLSASHSPPTPSATPAFLSTHHAGPPVISSAVSPPQPPTKSPNLKERNREPQMLRKKGPNGHNPLAAVGILKALDPHPDPTVEQSEESMTEVSYREEKKERRGFWERTGVKDKDKDRVRDKERQEEDSHADLTRMIGYLTATASEDWSLVLEVCERASAGEANAKEAVKALRREFKYAEPTAQLSAARLWAIMLRNSSELFISQCASRKFLDTLEDVITSSRTSPVVRERLLEVLAAAAYASPPGKDSGFRHLWRKVKPADKPGEGIPFDTDDAMFYPPTPRHPLPAASPNPDQSPMGPQRLPPAVPSNKPKTSSRNRVIPPEEDMRRLFQECKVGSGNAKVLFEALAFAKPEDLRKDIIREFYARCRASQELISAQIPWAFSGAERSRRAAGREQPLQDMRPSIDSNRTTSPVSTTDTDRTPELTPEEQLLADLLAANEELMEALRVYDDLERVGLEREAEERSRKEIRMDRSQLRYDDVDHSLYLDPGYPHHGGASSSRSASPSPSLSASSAPSFVVTPVIPSHTHPLPPIPTHGAVHPIQQRPLGSQGSIQSLAPPPHAPLGPRSPAYGLTQSRTPSPERSSMYQISHGSLENTPSAVVHDMSKLRLRENGLRDEEYDTPVKPSAKALGKRKVIEPVESDRGFDTDDLFYDHTDESLRSTDDPLDSDSEEGRIRGWHQPVHYVYDAAAERLQQRIKEGQLAAAALGVH